MPRERRGDKDNKTKPEEEPSNLIGGVLDIFGIKIDLGELISTPLGSVEQLEELREKLKQAGGRETVSDEDWKQGGPTVTGHIRTRGILGDQEYHIGTMGPAGGRASRQPAPEAPEVVEPPVDIFDEGDEITIVADVPGITMDDVDLRIDEGVFLLETRTTARRRYRKQIPIDGDPDPESLVATCHNGVLEVRLRKRAGEHDG